MTAIVTRGNAADLHLPDESVDLIVTSPPYFGLRSYQDGGEHYDGQIGDEATPTEYLDALIAATAEWCRVLKPGGSIFVNLGDKYSQRVAMRTSSHQDGLFPDRPELAKDWKASKARGEARMPYQNVINSETGQYVREKSLIGLPWRYAIRCIDELGLILRAEIVWSKPNGLPESVTDRVRRSHEQVFHFTKSPRYYSAVDETREAYAPGYATRLARGEGRKATLDHPSSHTRHQGGFTDVPENWTGNPLGKLPGSVWTIPTSPLKVPDHLGIDHFAAYPPELVRRIVLGWSPREVCTACGEGRRPVVGYDGPHDMAPVRVLTPAQVAEWSSLFAAWCKERGVTRRALAEASRTGDMGARWLGVGGMPSVPNPTHWRMLRERWPDLPGWFDEFVHRTELRPVRGGNYSGNGRKSGSARDAKQFLHDPPSRTITGYACACPDTTAPATPGVVLDPFGGTGTSALVASCYGRVGISVDLSADYCRLAKWRTTDPGERARVLGVDKPPVQVDGQLGLFEGGAA